MTYDSPILEHMVRKEYKAIGEHCYSIAQVLWVFMYYLCTYQNEIGREHPNIKAAQVRRIIEAMPYVGDCHERMSDIEPEDYSAMIDRHFKTKYQDGCDYNINHFFSGDIRQMRIYDAVL